MTVLPLLDQVLQPIKAITQATGFMTLMEIMQTAQGYRVFYFPVNDILLNEMLLQI